MQNCMQMNEMRRKRNPKFQKGFFESQPLSAFIFTVIKLKNQHIHQYNAAAATYACTKN